MKRHRYATKKVGNRTAVISARTPRSKAPKSPSCVAKFGTIFWFEVWPASTGKEHIVMQITNNNNRRWDLEICRCDHKKFADDIREMCARRGVRFKK